MATTYSNKSNAVRAFRTLYKDLADLSNSVIRMDVLDSADGRYALNEDVVSQIRAERAAANRRVVVTTTALAGVPMLRKSVAKGAVAKSHALFAALPVGTARKDAIAHAVAQGIAFFTARTQYQAWSRAA